MKVNVSDINNNIIQVNESVIKIRFLDDGRHLIYYNSKCTCCNQNISLVHQIPKGYSVQIILEESDEISCNKIQFCTSGT